MHVLLLLALLGHLRPGGGGHGCRLIGPTLLLQMELRLLLLKEVLLLLLL